MSTVELTTDNFDQIVADNEFVLIDFWADWCGPCRQFAPTYERVSENHSDVVFSKVDTEAQPQLAAAFDIKSIPTVAVIRDRVLLYAEPGALPEDALEDLIRQVRELDMNEVKAAAEQQEQGE
ncbi:thioredoxin [Prauserella shujinwangii]|uniref:Thioredoxin n=1 Tax=Prauserella shujinwangii TaxID=1453103 RepID=A0A2T0LLG8_9PSEU|nr:thioredoxin family protein [Prauserella shujinwangii]PRX43882.1 thioredoxin [Prauserella shujinwangii]